MRPLAKLFSRFRNYRLELVRRIYDGPLHGGSDALDALWPFFLGGFLFAGLDLSLSLASPLRLMLLAVFLMPGVAWGSYVLFHEVKSFPRRIRGHRARLEQDGEE